MTNEHLLVRQIVERLQHQHPEHQDGIERLPAGAAFLELARCEHHRLDVGAKALPPHETINGFERIAHRRTRLPSAYRHRKIPAAPSSPLRIKISRIRFAQVGRSSYFSRCPLFIISSNTSHQRGQIVCTRFLIGYHELRAMCRLWTKPLPRPAPHS